ncbi:MAG TPA: beta-L-arabinofuranosidase domain-containing protein [Labilithrix sp.]
MRGALLVFLLLTPFAGCSDCKAKASPPPDPAVYGEVAARDDVDFAPYVAVARAIVTKTDRPAVTPPPVPAQRAFVTVWANGAEPVVATAKRGTLFDSVVAAAEDAAKRAPSSAVRVEVDVIAKGEAVTLDASARETLAKLGTRGYVVATDADHVGFVSATEVVDRKYYDLSAEKDGSAPLNVDRLVGTLAARAGVDHKAVTDATIYAVDLTSRIDSAPPGRAIALYRGWPSARPASIDAGQLMEATRAGADYLARVIDSKGNYRYMVHAIEDQPDKTYGWLRHAGSTYALLEAFGELGDPVWLQKAREAILAIRAHVRTTPEGFAYLRDNGDEEQQKVGGAGLSILALAKFIELTGDKDQIGLMQGLANLIVHQQYADGHFRANADVEREDPTQKGLKAEVMYYPGEGTLGLLRAYAILKDPKYLDAAKKAADYIIDVRDAGKDDEHQLHDHWGAYALNDLYRFTKEQKYADHAFKIARAILKGETTADKAPAPDLAATFYAHGESTPTATRLEALAAVMELSRAMGKDTAWLDAAAQRYAIFLRAQQYDPDRLFFVHDPKTLLGGVRESLLVEDVRIDYTQHAMSGWIHLAKLLRDPKWGTISPSGPAPGSSARP